MTINQLAQGSKAGSRRSGALRILVWELPRLLDQEEEKMNRLGTALVVLTSESGGILASATTTGSGKALQRATGGKSKIEEGVRLGLYW